MWIRLLLPAVLWLGFAAALPALAESRAGDQVRITGVVAEDLYAAAGELEVDGAVDGDAVLSAGTLAIAGDVAGDAILAGGRITLTGGVGDDLRAAGGDVSVRGFVTDHAAIVGANVRLESGSAIAGRVWLAGGNVAVDGEIGGDLRVVGGAVSIAGQVEGNADISARRIRVEPGAVITGDLIWRSGQPPVIAENAQILGQVIEGSAPRRRTAGAAQGGRSFGSRLILAAAIFIAGAGLWWLSPVAVRRASMVFRQAPARTLVTGVVVLCVAPIAAVVLFVTVLGWLLGVLVLAGYLFSLVLAGLLGLLVAVQLMLPQLPGADSGRGRRLVLLLAFSGVLVYLQGVPFAGWLLSLLLMLAGLGAVARLVTGWREPDPA